MSDDMSPLEAYFSGSRDVSNRELFYVMVGIILGELYEKVPEPHLDLKGTRIWGTIRQSAPHYGELINQTIQWLVDEGLVREFAPRTKDKSYGYVLTAKGLSLMQTRPENPIGPDDENFGDTLSRLKNKAADSSVSALFSQTVGAILRYLGV